MTEDRGGYDPRPRHPNRSSANPEPLCDLLRQFVEERGWTELLLTPSSSNGHAPDEPTSGGRTHD